MSLHAVTVPKWGIEMQEATLADWKVAAGADVAKGDELVDMETEKIVNTHEAPAAGVVRRLVGEPGEVYAVGQLIAVIADGGESDGEVDAFIAGFTPVDASFDGGDDAHSAQPLPGSTPSAEPAAAGGEPSISPIARRLAESIGLEWRALTGTGRNGRISKQDVEAAAAAAASGAPIVRTALQKTVAARMQAAKQNVPHFYLDVTIDVGDVQAQRAAYNETIDGKATLNDVLLRAVADVLARHPAVNVAWREDELVPAADAVGVAIAAPEGLVAPVVHGVRDRSLEALARETRRLAGAAAERSLSAADLEGGALTVSNLGMYGIDRFTAIINPPQTSILAVGRALPAPVVRDGTIAVRECLSVTLSCDHRAFDGAAGAAFLADLRTRLEAPDGLFR